MRTNICTSENKFCSCRQRLSCCQRMRAPYKDNCRGTPKVESARNNGPLTSIIPVFNRNDRSRDPNAEWICNASEVPSAINGNAEGLLGSGSAGSRLDTLRHGARQEKQGGHPVVPKYERQHRGRICELEDGGRYSETEPLKHFCTSPACTNTPRHYPGDAQTGVP